MRASAAPLLHRVQCRDPCPLPLRAAAAVGGAAAAGVLLMPAPAQQMSLAQPGQKHAAEVRLLCTDWHSFLMLSINRYMLMHWAGGLA